MSIKKVTAAVFSAVFISAAGLAVSAAGSASTLNINNAIAATTENATKSSETTLTSSTETTTVTTEPTTEPTTLKTYYIKFLDFDGNLMTTLEVEEGDPINYGSVDTSSLHKHFGVNTEQGFSSWDITILFTRCQKQQLSHSINRLKNTGISPQREMSYLMVSMSL